MFLSFYRVVFIFILVSKSVANELEVYDKIFKNYQQNIRPVKDSNTTTYIDITPNIFVVFEMDPATESIQFSLDFEMKWTDEYLNWDMSAFGIETISVPEQLIWLPDVCMMYSYESTPLIAVERRKVRIGYDGVINQWNPQIVTHYCAMKVDNFPFDTQTCIIYLAPWTMIIQNIVLQIENPLSLGDLSTGLFRGNTEWQMLSFVTANINYTAPNGELHSSAGMTVTLKRNSVYYISVMIAPTFIITTLCLLGIFAPFSSEGVREEKVTLGLTTLLTIAVILNAVAAEMPKTSKLPLLGWFVLGELLICAVATLVAVAIMFLHERVFMHQYLPPNWLSCIFLCSMKNNYDLETQKTIHKEKKSIDENRPVSSGNGMNEAFDDLRMTLLMVRNHIEEEKMKELIHYQWSTIIEHIDFFFLVAFQVVNILGSLWLLVF